MNVRSFSGSACLARNKNININKSEHLTLDHLFDVT